MSLSDWIFGKPHRVLQVQMRLVDEETGREIARKCARIHETDINAGKIHLAQKSAEIIRDAEHALSKETV